MSHTFVGNLVEDPVSSVTESGISRVRLRIACSEKYRDKKGQWQDTDPVFWVCYAWDQRAEQIQAQGWRKGDPVIVVGDFATQRWEDKDGSPRSRTTITIRSVGPDVTRPRKVTAQDVPITGNELPTLGQVNADAEVDL